MIQLALGFVTAHPAVTSGIIGPRTLDHLHSQIAAADTVLCADVLDAIDAVVAPGRRPRPGEKSDTPPALLDPALRRRCAGADRSDTSAAGESREVRAGDRAEHRHQLRRLRRADRRRPTQEGAPPEASVSSRST